MKLLRFVLVLVFTVALTIALNLRIAGTPPIGKFLDPFHGFWRNAANTETAYTSDENLTIPFLKQEAKVLYDEHLIPHIFAGNDHDLYLLQGYVTAAHRLWQMDFQTMAAAGRVSEIVGEQALEFDRLKRRKGMVFGAHNAVQAFMENDTLKEMVEAYAKGVNAYISSLEYDNLPIEYKLLDYQPEAWSPLKTALLLKYMAEDLSGSDSDLENTNAYHLLGEERFNFLFPDTLNNTDPVIPKETSYDFEPVQVDSPEHYVPKVLTKATIPNPDPRNGSNNWAISGSKTNSGKPILANDPHLGLNLPNLWFVMQLNAPGINAMGATLPGALGVIIGFNESIAWGVTNARRDVQDWYSLQFKDEERNEYLFDGKWLKTQKVSEEIKIRGKASFFDTVVYSHYGPVVYDKNFPGNKEKNNFSLRWVAHDPSQEQYTFHLLNRADNYEEFTEAIQFYHSPAQNFAFASKDGDISLWVQGKFPLKWAPQGKFIMDGSLLNQGWQGYIPFEHNPHVLNPERGFVSSANQYPVGKNYPYYVYDGNYEDFRNKRINNKLEAMDNITPQDVMTMQNDNYSLKAAESLPMMLDSLRLDDLNENEKQIYALLKNWDYFYEVESKAATAYELWWKNLYGLLWDEFQADTLALNAPEANTTIHFLKNYPDDPFIDIQETAEREDLNQLVLLSYRAAVDSLERWTTHYEEDYKWANYKGTTAQHLLRQDAFSIRDIAIGGNSGTINAANKRHGPSWRMVVSLEEEIKAWGIYPGGQSGSPGSPYYDNFIERWRKGEHIPLLFLKSAKDTSKIKVTHTISPFQNEE